MNHFKIVICALLLSIFSHVPILCIASEQVTDGPIARNQLKSTVQNLLYQEKFDVLDGMAQEFRKTKARFPEGLWKLQFFYEGLVPKDKSPEGWKNYLAIVGKWFEKSPDSITARVAAGSAWEEYGAYVRGKGYADTVTEEMWRVLGESFQKAYGLLENKPSDPTEDCPERYATLLNIARVQGWPRPQFEALFHEAVTFEPTYYPFYLLKARYLLPRWHGEEGEWQQFAKDAISLTPESEGKSVYMRIVGSFLIPVDITSFSDPGISWSLLKQGYLDVERNFPGSRWNLNMFCKYACKAGDKETAKELFKRIGDKPYIEAWGTRTEFEQWRKWAGDET